VSPPIAGGGSGSPVSPNILAVGWATVDSDRAVDALESLLILGSTFRAAPDSPLLGARCLVATIDVRRIDLAAVRGTADGTITAVVLEPSTEGRLAATLARHGEGWCVIWEQAGPGPGPRSLSPERPGPFGPERLLLGGPASGPHRLFASTATIGP
jgi:hypothetical protein